MGRNIYSVESKPKNNILPEMFDVRPAMPSGELDWERIEQVRRSSGRAPITEASILKSPTPEPDPVSKKLEYSVFELGVEFREEAPMESSRWNGPDRLFGENDTTEETIDQREEFFSFKDTEDRVSFFSEREDEEKIFSEEPKSSFSGQSSQFSCRDNWKNIFRRIGIIGSSAAIVLFLLLGARSISMRGTVLGESETGIRNLSLAIDSIRSGKQATSVQAFDDAYQSFSSAWSALGIFQFDIFDSLRFVPGLSFAASGKNMIEAGKHIAAAGKLLTEMSGSFVLLGNPLYQGGKDGAGSGESKQSFLEMLSFASRLLTKALPDLEAADASLALVTLDDVPEEKRAVFLDAREKLSTLVGATREFLDQERLFRELLGANGPRKYLFLFQNNHEIRPTGGFIGSYGLLDMKDGEVRKFFVDGIFNPDGQLKVNIVPPQPIQKVSAGWSLHDSNWFPDFPASAEKASYFYEKTGGPTVDGVIAITPDVIRDLLRVFGPVEMKEYGVTIDADNFVSTIQEEVETRYDREENQPKKILSDLAPILLDRMFASRDPKALLAVIRTLSENLSEKHILVYLKNADGEVLLDRFGWSGRILSSEKDYLSVVNTNINGYKTDGVIDESIEHTAKIREDGSVVDTVRVTRKHTGGRTSYEWWNKVNADYLRVYVPKGSKLLSAKGYTREMVKSPLDYSALGFREDSDIVNEEGHVSIDPETGTRIGEEFGKTVFGNWTYVSPGETMTLEYEYILPFRVIEDGKISYASLYQKQSGSRGSALSSIIFAPSGYRVSQKTEGEYAVSGSAFRWKTDLIRDRFGAVVFSKE